MLGQQFERPISETRLVHVKKQVEELISQLRDIIASNVVPALLQSDKSCQQVALAIKIFPRDIGLTLQYEKSIPQLQECLSILETISRLEGFLNATFEIFSTSHPILEILDKNSISCSSYYEFLSKFFKYFPIHSISIHNKTESVPMFESKLCSTFILEGNYSILNKSFVTTVSQNEFSLLNLDTGERSKFQSDYIIDIAFPFGDGCIGVFSKSEEKSFFQMFGRPTEEEETQGMLSVPTENIIAYDISNRRLALLQSSNKLFSVVDLESIAEEDEE